jgi:hypothetical protein
MKGAARSDKVIADQPIIFSEEQRMNGFIQHHRDRVMGVLSGFDRVRFRGTLRWLCYPEGLGKHLSYMKVLLKDFAEYSQGVTARVRQAAEQIARAAGRPVEYLASPSRSKEERARDIAARDSVEQGLICVVTAVEPCQSFRIGRDGDLKKLVLQSALRKCLHYYFYWIHPLWGFCHARLQSWLPLTVQVCFNGREWLSRQMDAAGLNYLRRENCFVWIEDPAAAQRLMDQQLRTNWAEALNALLPQFHPTWRQTVENPSKYGYYWSIQESEWATDVMFHSESDLASLYPRLIRHATIHLGSREVLRFLGRRVPASGGVPARFNGQVVSDLRHRPEGLRVKHWANSNSIKMYDKQGSVLRIETTLNNPDDVRVYRPREGDPGGPKSWRVLRRGVADAHRRAEVGQQANDRYLESLATAEEPTPLGELTARLCRPVRWKKHRVRGLNPLSPEDTALLEAVGRGEFLLNGFRNRDLRERLFSRSDDPATRRRQSAAVTRKLRMLRAHGLIRKVPRTHRYLLSAKGQRCITALLAAQAADTAKLTRAA